MRRRPSVTRVQPEISTRAAVCAIALAAVLSHVVALGHGFIWLDHQDLEAGNALAAVAQWPGLFTHGFSLTGLYRPLTALSLSVDGLSGSPWVFHADNLLWHALAALALFGAAQALGLSRRAALFAASLFAVHPVGVEVVNAIAFRPELLLATALFSAIWAHLKGRPVLAGLAVLAAGLVKESGLVLAPLFLAIISLPPRPRPRAHVWALEGIGVTVALALRLAFAPAWKSSFPSLSVGEVIGTRAAAFGKSMVRLLLPIDPSFCDAFEVRTFVHPLALAGLAVGVAVAVYGLRRKGIALLFLVSLVPSLSLVPLPRFWSPHYLYVPAALLACLVCEALADRGSRQRLGLTLTIVALGMFSLWDSRRYSDDESLFTPEVAAEPRCREAHFYLAEIQRKKGQLEAAADGYQQAATPVRGVLSFSSEPAALQNLGLVRMAQGKLDLAERALTQALQYPLSELDRRHAVHNLAAVATVQKNWERVETLLSAETARPCAARIAAAQRPRLA